MVVIFQGQKPFLTVKIAPHANRETGIGNASLTVICPREITTTLRRIAYIFAATRSLASDGLRKQNIGEVVDEGFMSAQQTIDELVRMMRARALRYKILAEALYDRRTAAEVSAYAEELEAEAERLADSRRPSVPKRLGVLCH